MLCLITFCDGIYKIFVMYIYLPWIFGKESQISVLPA